jgi:hypothetical protein
VRSNQITLTLQKYVNLNLLLLEAVYFKSVDVNMAHEIYAKIFTEFNLNFVELLALYKLEFVTSMVVSGMLWVTASFNYDLKFKYNWMYVGAMLFLIIFIGQDLKNQFVYFQF